jgi:hypothetical protein
MTRHRGPKLSGTRRRATSGPVSKQTASARTRATAILVEQFYVAVDRQLKSGYATYEAAEKAAREIKKRHPNPRVTVFDAKESDIPLSNKQLYR